VADLVKRRMSTRFPVPGEQEDVPPMPSIPDMPSIPAGIGAKLPAQPRRGESKGPDIDLDQFRESAFDPEKCALDHILGLVGSMLIGYNGSRGDGSG